MPKIIQEGSRQEKDQRETGRNGKSSSVWDDVKEVSLGSKKDSMIAYGHSGSGKTTFACTYPKPLLLLGTEDGTRSVHNIQGVWFKRVQTTQQIRQMVQDIREGKADREYQTVVLDTVTELQDMTLKEVLNLDELPVQKSFKTATRDDYGDSALITKEILRDILRLSELGICHCLILGQERAFNAESDSPEVKPYICVSATDSVVRFLNPAVDYNVQLYVDQKEEVRKVKVNGKIKTIRKTLDEPDYRMRLKAHSIYKIKFRCPKGSLNDDYISDPNYEKIRELIEGKSIKEKTDVH